MIPSVSEELEDRQLMATSAAVGALLQHPPHALGAVVERPSLPGVLAALARHASHGHGAVVVSPALKTLKFQPAQLPVDLILTKLDVKSLGGNQFLVTATLSNGDPLLPVLLKKPGQTYPGGGTLVLHRTSGGTVLAPPGPNRLFLSTPDLGTDFASKPIPALPYGKSIQLSAVTTGRAIFSAAALAPPQDPDSHTPPTLPEINPNNDAKTVDALTPVSLDLDSNTLSGLLHGTLGSAQIRLDSGDSFLKIPGVIDYHFTVPAVSTVGPVFSPFGFPLIPTTYAANNIVSTGVTASYQGGALVLTVSFADNDDALHADSAAANITVKNLTMTVTLPLGYDSADQYIFYHDPSVQVNGSWSFHGPAGVLPIPFDINAEVQKNVTQRLSDPSVKDQIEFGLNQQLRKLIPGGRINGITFGPSTISINAETASA